MENHTNPHTNPENAAMGKKTGLSDALQGSHHAPTAEEIEKQRELALKKRQKQLLPPPLEPATEDGRAHLERVGKVVAGKEAATKTNPFLAAFERIERTARGQKKTELVADNPKLVFKSDDHLLEVVRGMVWAAMKAEAAATGHKACMHPIQKPLYNNLSLYIAGLDSCAWDLHKGLYVFGAVGVGKSYFTRVMIAAFEGLRAYCQNVVDTTNCAHTRLAFQHNLQIIHRRAPVAIAANSIVHEWSSDEARTKFRKTWISEAHSLVIDDLGQENPTIKVYGNEFNPCTELICERYESLFKKTRICTHFTSNVSVKSLAQCYQKDHTRLISRIVESCNEVHFVGLDLRTRYQAWLEKISGGGAKYTELVETIYALVDARVMELLGKAAKPTDESTERANERANERAELFRETKARVALGLIAKVNSSDGEPSLARIGAYIKSIV